MLTRVLESGVGVCHDELAGKRILITGLDLHAGVDVARNFAEQGCRIVLQTTASGAEVDAVLEMLAQTASELQVYSDPLTDTESTVRFAQTAAKAFSGLDAVVNLLQLSLDGQDIEGSICRQIQCARLLTRIAANRMRLTWSEGLILNIIAAPAPTTGADAALQLLARSMLADMTRSEATDWAAEAIRINAVAPSVPLGDANECLSSEPGVAALAMFLASPRGRDLSGLVFEAALTQTHP